MPPCFLDKVEPSTKLRVGTLLIVMIMLDLSCFPLSLSCGPSAKGTQATCSHFLSPQTRHWTAVRLE